MATTTDNYNGEEGGPTNKLFCAIGSPTTSLDPDEVKKQIFRFLDNLGPREDVLLLPPDFTRYHSKAGMITQFIAEYYNFIDEEKESEEDDSTDKGNEPEQKKAKQNDDITSTSSSSHPKIQVLPALGTHAPMTENEIKNMFGEKLAKKTPSPFLVHNWRSDVVTIGHAPAHMVKEATNGLVDEPWPAQLNKLVWEKRYDDDTKTKTKNKSLVLSIGQVVPHEVMGMANFNKNLFVGTGGVEAINLSHFIGAVYGMENMLGTANNPLRSILNYASEKYLQKSLDLWYILTVMGANKETGKLEMKGLYIGNDIECYNKACELSLQVNFTILENAPKKMIVHLSEDEFHSTWLGNKAIYRTRMAIATDGELIILAPGIKRFGEDDKVDELIRKYGYVGTPKIMEDMNNNTELKENLSAVAHLIHGSSEGRFKVTYCPGKHVSAKEIEQVGFQYGDLDAMKKKYNFEKLKDGWNNLIVTNEEGKEEEEEIYYVSNPALGLWAEKSKIEARTGIVVDGDKAETQITKVDIDISGQKANDGSGGVGGWAKPPADL